MTGLSLQTYNERMYQQEIADKAYKKCIAGIRRTEELRVKLNKNCTLETALELIGIYSGQEYLYNKMEVSKNE